MKKAKKIKKGIAPRIKEMYSGEQLVFPEKEARYSVISATVGRLNMDYFGKWSISKSGDYTIVTKTK